MKKKFIFSILPLLFIFFTVKSQDEGVKFEIFHVDLVPATFMYGTAELAWSLAMYDALDKTIEAQTEIDTLFRKLVILEEKTQEYQKNLQAAFIQSLNPAYVDFIVSQINDNQKWIDEYVILYPQYNGLAENIKHKITDRAEKIKRYINDAAKKTGNEGRLDNKQRNDLNIYVLEELMRLRFVSLNTIKMLAAVNPMQSTLKIPLTTD